MQEDDFKKSMVVSEEYGENAVPVRIGHNIYLVQKSGEIHYPEVFRAIISDSGAKENNFNNLSPKITENTYGRTTTENVIF
jgi:hypothetical protein